MKGILGNLLQHHSLKTAKSPLDSKEFKLVNLKENQPWILLGKTDAEVEAPVFWSSDVNSHLILWHLLFLMPLIFPSIRDFPNESAVCTRWPKYWSFSFSISSSSEYSGLISLKIDWFDLLAVQGTFRSLLQHHSLKASVLWCSAFYMVQLSQLYVTTGKTIVLTI